AEAINRSLLIRMVVFEGVSSLRPILTLLGEDTKQRYTSICGMCFEVFSDPRKVEKLARFFEQLESEALGDAMAELAEAASLIPSPLRAATSRTTSDPFMSASAKAPRRRGCCPPRPSWRDGSPNTRRPMSTPSRRRPRHRCTRCSAAH